MLHKHHSTYHAAGFLACVLLLGGVLGGSAALIGQTVVDGVEALQYQDASSLTSREEAILRNAKQRRLRKQRRLGQTQRFTRDVRKTYPSETNSLLLTNQSEKWEVALRRGMLSYPALGIEAPMGKPSLTEWKQRNWRGLEGQMQFGLLHGVVAYPHSPSPGGVGTIIIAGHSSAPTLDVLGSAYEEVFARLPEAKIGDRIILRDEEGRAYTYEVHDAEVIPATEVSILLQDATKREMILMTCYPVGTTKERFTVRATLVSGQNLAGSEAFGKD